MNQHDDSDISEDDQLDGVGAEPSQSQRPIDVPDQEKIVDHNDPTNRDNATNSEVIEEENQQWEEEQLDDIEQEEAEEEEQEWEDEEEQQEEELGDNEQEEAEEEKEQGSEQVEEQDEEPSQGSLPKTAEPEKLSSQQPTQILPFSAIEIADGTLPLGMLRKDEKDTIFLDTLAGRCSSLGLSQDRFQESIANLGEQMTSDSAVWMTRDEPANHPEKTKGKLSQQLRQSLRPFLDNSPGLFDDLIHLSPSADSAIDTAISMARRLKEDSCYQTIAFVGSDHGRTGMCRSASGVPKLHDGFGPMMAGFTHLPMGDLKAFNSTLNEHTACVLISPVNLLDAAIPFDPNFLLRVREQCDSLGIPLLIDETQLVFGATGRPCTFQTLAEIHADLTIISAGLFNGLPGGLILGGSQFTDQLVDNADDLPIHAGILRSTLRDLNSNNLINPWPEDVHPIAVIIAEAISGYEFIRDINATGLTIGIETDIESSRIEHIAKQHGVRLRVAGDTAVCLQPPLQISEIEQEALVERLNCTMESLEREFSDASL
ncbi:aminotransferase class III-fold pyridoxal phosphate-dependent enzyme [Rubripirellula sp.]|nr:aminotransferase class III-fold pyridoxal phosphate-dependent enzyme [Rubripirellula sp.]MDB4338961.1 aminotransferase class III-fold pyridoxal phosphate-dependent enzyme [Rubripirellula sp.]